MKKSILRVAFCAVLWALLIALGGSVDAQQTKKVYRVGYLSPRLGIEARGEAFRQSMRDLGYVERETW